ncbi:unnamed protein product [Cyberlindnera jadinii]|uniref:PHD-type domain-containing protein n=1 Tax=Cyberlindnera jadinii (strain ATCC 18201 / CBS 1600 / BCRC 20928 / JCM 3617 / NBRC 0987 / NRRL Y-1542) TaxID=983966 RepID=A0A0H5C483_CYBJN|nr:hypothetical protein CYBJADRAFT_166141 [Cyberlindnera jadinii NRRL Y-1542]ODV75410.1 hypothetical protein CYBJADRAFT_166141 [Cyberlindnera jadinii NRRL Y-1542]CEP22552.1 unnamed protein product [Cyberlindnera jadinii]
MVSSHIAQSVSDDSSVTPCSSNTTSRRSSRPTSPSVVLMKEPKEPRESRKRHSSRLVDAERRKQEAKLEEEERKQQQKKRKLQKDKELVLKKNKNLPPVDLDTADVDMLSTFPAGVSKKPSKLVTIDKRGKLTFIEPENDEPLMSVTGLPLAAPPNSKIKKEALWPRKKAKKSKASTPITGEEDSESSSVTPLSQDDYLGALQNQLKTKINERLQKPSHIRSSSKPVDKNGADIYGRKFRSLRSKESSNDTIEKTPQRKRHAHSPITGKNTQQKRKIKNSSPKKSRENPFGYNNPMQLAGSKRENAFDVLDPTKDNEDFCSSCGEPGIFLCCEGCPKSFHFACCYPPFDESNLPEGEWLCTECNTKKNPPKPHKQGLFAKLLDQLERRNPTQFRLPRRIRERFEGVVTGHYGEYETTDYKPYRPAKIGSFEQTNPELHYDKDGNVLVCVKCGLTGISPDKTMGDVDKPIINCEYCPSTWHLDCLDPPLSTVKQLGTKWKCPNHADHLMPESNKNRRLKKPNIIDVDQVHGFKNDGNIEILLEKSDDEDGIFHHIPTPPFFENEDVPHGISATPNKTQLKLWRDEFAVHRVPERGVVLDFLGKVQANKTLEIQQMITHNLKINKENNDLLKKLVTSDKYEKKEKATIKSLVQLKEGELQDLAKIATKELASNSLSEFEVEELLEIKRLIALKGKGKLLEFLKS